MTDDSIPEEYRLTPLETRLLECLQSLLATIPSEEATRKISRARIDRRREDQLTCQSVSPITTAD